MHIFFADTQTQLRSHSVNSLEFSVQNKSPSSPPSPPMFFLHFLASCNKRVMSATVQCIPLNSPRLHPTTEKTAWQYILAWAATSWYCDVHVCLLCMCVPMVPCVEDGSDANHLLVEYLQKMCANIVSIYINNGNVMSIVGLPHCNRHHLLP